MSSEGARKAALLLSILDSATASALLGLFEPEVAQRIADEANYVKNVKLTEKDVEPIVDEFVKSLGLVDANLTDVLLGEAKRSVEQRRLERDSSIEAQEQESDAENVSVLDALSGDLIASALGNERPTVVGSILSRLSSGRRKEVEDNLTSRELYENTPKCGLFLLEEQSSIRLLTIRRLENALFESALEDE